MHRHSKKIPPPCILTGTLQSCSIDGVFSAWVRLKSKCTTQIPATFATQSFKVSIFPSTFFGFGFQHYLIPAKPDILLGLLYFFFASLQFKDLDVLETKAVLLLVIIMAELFQTHASKSQRLRSAVHTPSSQRVFNRQALNQVATGRFPLQEIYTVYLQLEILYFDTSMMDSMNLKADKLFLQESRFNENTRKQKLSRKHVETIQQYLPIFSAL